MIRNFKKPLIIIGPKILLRHPLTTSSLCDMGPGSSFKNVIGQIKNLENLLFIKRKTICKNL